MTYIPEIDFKRHLSVHMYSLLNGDTYSNDQKQSILKFRLILDLGNMQSEGGGVRRSKIRKAVNVTLRTNISAMPRAC